MAFHGIEIIREVSGAQPFQTPGQSTLGTVVSATLPVDGKYGDGTNGIYNRAYNISAPPSEDDIGTDGTAERVFDQIFKNGIVPTQVVFVPVGATQTARAAQSFTDRALAAATVDTKAELDALTAASFQILTVGDFQFLAFNNVNTADVTKFNMLVPGDTITFDNSGIVKTIMVERPFSETDEWFRITDGTTISSLTAGTTYGLDSPSHAARTADENEYDNLLGRQAAQTGIYALRAASPVPKILFVGHELATTVTGGIANGLASGLASLARELRSVAVIDGPGTDDVDQTQLAASLYNGSEIYFVDPHIIIKSDGTTAPASPSVAALISVNDRERGYWTSPSNRVIQGALGVSREVSYGFEGSEADNLNRNQIATIIKDGGFRLWGNEGLNTTDPTYRFLQIYRTANAIEESLRVSLKNAIDQNITVRFFENVAQSCNSFLAKLQAAGTITGGRCYPDRDFNTAATVKSGIAAFVVRWSGVYPAQTLRIRLELTDDFLISNLIDQI